MDFSKFACADLCKRIFLEVSGLALDDETAMTAIVITPGAAPLPASAERLKPLAASALGYMEESKAAGTREAYARHWVIFERWCGEHGLLSLPATPEVVAM